MAKPNKKKIKNKIKNKNVVLGITLILLIMLTLLGIAYGFYETNIIGNTQNEQSVNLTSDKLEIIYDTEENNEPITGSVDEADSTNSYSKTFTIKSTAKETGKYTIILDNIENNFVKTWDWTYKLYKIEENGQLVEEGTATPIAEGVIGKELKRQVIRAEEEIEAGKTNKYKLEVTYDNTQPDGKIINKDGTEESIIETGSNLKFRINIMEVNENIFKEDSEKGMLLYAIGENNSVVNPLTTPGKKVSTADETELSYSEDDYGTSYYFRGNVENNYVTFHSMCWRIVRILGNGDIKIILNDKSHTCEKITDDNITDTSAFINDGRKARFTKSDATDPIDRLRLDKSNVLEILNKWMQETGLETNSNISDRGEWCMDLSIIFSDTSGVSLGTLGRQTDPSFHCNFNGFGGSVALRYRGNVALLTLDEVEYAGAAGKSVGSSTYYLNSGDALSWWTMSPRSSGLEGVVYIAGSSWYSLWANYTLHVRPALILKANVTISDGGIGTKEQPYVIPPIK